MNKREELLKKIDSYVTGTMTRKANIAKRNLLKIALNDERPNFLQIMLARKVCGGAGVYFERLLLEIMEFRYDLDDIMERIYK